MTSAEFAARLNAGAGSAVWAARRGSNVQLRVSPPATRRRWGSGPAALQDLFDHLQDGARGVAIYERPRSLRYPEAPLVVSEEPDYGVPETAGRDI